MAGRDREPRSFAENFAAFVTLVWAAAGVIGAVTGRYTFLQLVTPVELIAAGYVLTARVVRNGNNRNGR